MSNPRDVDIEKGVALAAVLDQLFEQYPAEGSINAGYWRQQAIARAVEGSTTYAIFYARYTGVPDDVLNALRGLLDG